MPEHRIIASRGGRSKYKGVNPVGTNGRWFASICRNYKRVYLGTFDTEIEAALAYDTTARELFGEYARLNFPHGYSPSIEVKESQVYETRPLRYENPDVPVPQPAIARPSEVQSVNGAYSHFSEITE